MNYPNLKVVSTPSEDICDLCFKFANLLKFHLNDKQLYPSLQDTMCPEMKEKHRLERKVRKRRRMRMMKKGRMEKTTT